jgi:hypothetical protein
MTYSIHPGKHLRHARDHFEALLDSASVDSPKFSYDVRKRDLPMESNLLAAAEALKATVQRLENIVPHVSVSKPVTLDAVTPYQQTVGSTFGREVLTFHECRQQLADLIPALVLWSSHNTPLGDGMLISSVHRYTPLTSLQVRVISGEMVLLIPRLSLVSCSPIFRVLSLMIPSASHLPPLSIKGLLTHPWGRRRYDTLLDVSRINRRLPI